MKHRNKHGFFLSFLLLLFSCGGQEPSEEAIRTYLRGKSLYLERRWDEALLVLGENERRNPGFARNSLLRGKTLLFKKDAAGAEAVFRGVLKKNPHHEEAAKWLVRILLAQGNLKEARKHLAHGLETDPEDAELLLLMGKAHLREKDLCGAVEYFTKAEACFAKLAEAPLELADLYRGFGLREKSLSRLELARAMLGKESGLSRQIESEIAELKRELKK